jgi:hypothetical protein
MMYIQDEYRHVEEEEEEEEREEEEEKEEVKVGGVRVLNGSLRTRTRRENDMLTCRTFRVSTHTNRRCADSIRWSTSLVECWFTITPLPGGRPAAPRRSGSRACAPPRPWPRRRRQCCRRYCRAARPAP